MKVGTEVAWFERGFICRGNIVAASNKDEYYVSTGNGAANMRIVPRYMLKTVSELDRELPPQLVNP